MKRASRMTRAQRRAAERQTRASGWPSRADACEVVATDADSRTLSVPPALAAMLEDQRDAFVARFGREPTDDDPILFDPDVDEPTPINEWKLRAHQIADMLLVGVRPEMVYATARTGVMIVEGVNEHLARHDDIVAFRAAVAEFREARGDARPLPPIDPDDDHSGRPSVVYVLRARGDGMVKIGVTTNLAGRLRSLRASSPSPLEVVAVVPGDAALERKFHGMFAAHRRHGEWFDPAPELLAFVETLRWGPP